MNNGTIRVNRSEFQIYVSQAKAIPFHFQSTDLGMPFSIKRRFYIGYKTQIYQIKMFFPVFAISSGGADSPSGNCGVGRLGRQ